MIYFTIILLPCQVALFRPNQKKYGKKPLAVEATRRGAGSSLTPITGINTAG